MTKVKDPVCKIDIDTDEAYRAGLTSDHQGHLYHFCSKQCKAEFERDPVAYASTIPHHNTQGTDDPMGAYTN